MSEGRHRTARRAVFIATTIGLAVPSMAQVIDLANGHTYYLSDSFMRPIEAQAWAQSLGGHLVTINDEAENTWVWETFVSNACGDGGIGLWQEAGSCEPGCGWSWITGEKWEYTNWAPGEPNDAAGGEDRLAIYGSGNPDSEIGTWNDDRAGAGNTGFVVEFPTTCPADLNGDTLVDTSDLIILLAFWSDCPPKCLGDIDDNSDVGFSDLLILLAAWGSCR